MTLSASAVASGLESLGLDCEVVGDPAVMIDSATHDSRRVTPGGLFVCLRGDSFDGHEFASQAVSEGAVALMVDHRLEDVVATQLVVADTRRAAGHAASVIAGAPSSALTTVGVTGTNGKTTVAQMVAAILESTGNSTGVIGTLHGPRTTPEATELQRTLSDFVDAGHGAAVMEVSSHALALHRVDGTTFDVVAFTNFGHDHLDLHGTPEEYFRAKSQLFDARFAPIAVINVDDAHGRVLADVLIDRDGDAAVRVVEVSERDLTSVRVASDSHGYVWRDLSVTVPIGGDFNISNSLMALSIAVELGIEPDVAAAGIEHLSTVPGRFEQVVSPHATRRGISVVVDYAHTPDGLAQLLTSARGIVGDEHAVIVTFGCGGERDRDKRAEMGAVAARLADRVIVTSDNPRREDPEAIIDDVMSGISERYGSSTTSEPDRRAAIAQALDAATSGDIVLIAGKGHETTQDLGDVVHEFDDRVVARSLLADSDPDASSSVNERTTTP